VDSEVAKVDSEVEILDHEKCTKQHALSVARNVKFLSSQQKAGLYFAKSAIRKRNHSSRSFALYFFLFFKMYPAIAIFWQRNPYKTTTYDCRYG